MWKNRATDQRIKEISMENPHNSMPGSRFFPSFPGRRTDSLRSNRRPDAEEIQSPPLLDRFRNMEIREPEIDCMSHKRDSCAQEENEDIPDRKESRESDCELEEYNETKQYGYPLRPGAEDCAYYMRTSECKYGLSCKFNHPLSRINQENGDFKEKSDQIDCKYYLRTGGCKYGDACRYVHSMAKTPVPPISELNFLGLPIRPGEKECPYYMRNGSCKFGGNCKFNHPDSTTGDDSPSTYPNGVSGGPNSWQANVSSWYASRPLTETETPAYTPVMFSHPRKFSSQPSEWNGYQAPVFSQEQSMHPRVTYLMDHITVADGSVYAQHQPRSIDEFPERPGQAECSYFMKTGDCKFKSGCKFHHPKNRMLKPPPCILSDKGLPLRPDQNICAHYNRYGICKFGPACKFDHPIHLPDSTSSDPDQPFNNSPAAEYASINRSQTHIM